MEFYNKTKELVNNNAIFARLEKYVALIEEYNKVMNLTGFTGDKLWQEGIYESLILFVHKPKIKSMTDIGAGAGFPSVPYAIFNPSVQLTIVEPMQKRCEFLKIVRKEVDAHNIFIARARAEDYYDKRSDVVTARAVAELGILIEISYHLGNRGCTFIFPKGPKVFEELERAQDAIKKYNIKPNVLNISNSNNKELFVVEYEKIDYDDKPKVIWKDIVKKYEGDK